MKEEARQSTYELYLVGNNTDFVSFQTKHLIDLDTLSTNFKNKADIISYLNTNYEIDFEVKDIYIFSDKNIIEMIFNDAREIVADQGLVSKISKYLEHYDNIKNLDLTSLHDRFLISKISEIMYSPTMKEYNFRLNNFKKNVLSGYKHKRDTALLIDRRKKEIGNRFFDINYNNMFNKCEVEGLLMGLGLSLKEIKENTQMGMDEYLEYLIANKDKIDFSKEVSSSEDISDLDGYEKFDVYDGNRGRRK